MIWHRQYTLIFDLTRFGIHDLCWRIAESDITASLSRHQSRM